MAKKNQFEKSMLDLNTAIDDPFAEEKNIEPKKEKAPVKEIVSEEVEEPAKPRKKASKKKDAPLSFEELVDYMNSLPPSTFKSKMSTVKVPAEFVEIIKAISNETDKISFHIATALIQMGLSRMKEDIAEMIDRKSKNKIDLL